MIKMILEYAVGIAAFNFACHMIGVDTSAALMIVSQAVGQPWLPIIALDFNVNS